jgi:hypothetical protein
VKSTSATWLPKKEQAKKKTNPGSQVKENPSPGILKSEKQYQENDKKLQPTWDSAARSPGATSSTKLSPWIFSAS